MLQGVEYYADFITGLLNGTFQIDHAGTFPSPVYWWENPYAIFIAKFLVRL